MKVKGPKPNPDDIELYPDAWERFEKAVKGIVKHPPMHREPKAKEPHGKPKAKAKNLRAAQKAIGLLIGLTVGIYAISAAAQTAQQYMYESGPGGTPPLRYQPQQSPPVYQMPPPPPLPSVPHMDSYVPEPESQHYRSTIPQPPVIYQDDDDR